jgi:hypothetical protein
VQGATANRALRHLSHKNQRGELDATRTCAPHEMHENRRRERRDAEEKQWRQERHKTLRDKKLV